MKKASKVLIGVAALILVAVLAIGATLAFLKDETEPVENTFTVGDINITLTESDNLDLKIIPGKTITKDPKVTVKGGSEACWLFVKIEKENWPTEGLTYGLASEWFSLTGEDGVYYREVAAGTSDQVFAVLENDHVFCADTLTKANLEAMNTNPPKLTFTAYAIQKEGITSASAAWTAINQ